MKLVINCFRLDSCQDYSWENILFFPDGERKEESDDECSDSEDENKTTVEELLQQAELQKAVCYFVK